MSRLGLSPKTIHNKKDGIPLLLRDSKLKGGIACFRTISLIKIHDKEFHPHQIDYPLAMLARQLLCEEKTQKPGEAFSLRAWQNFPTLPQWCKEYIEEFLARGNEKDHFWTLLVADPIYSRAHDSWRAKLFGKSKPRKEEDLTSVLVIFKHCTKETIRKETGPENMFDPLVDKLSGPIGEIVALIKERWNTQRERNKEEDEEKNRGRKRHRRRRRVRSREQSRSRSGGSVSRHHGSQSIAEAAIAAYDAIQIDRSRRGDVEEGLVEYGPEPVYATQNGAVPVDSEESGGVELMDLDETEEELMEKIMVLYTGLPPSYSENDGRMDMNSVDGSEDAASLALGGFVEEIE